jgi:hypothetical protein
MKYYKVTLSNGDTLYHESKRSLSDSAVIRELVDFGEIDPADVDDETEVDQITEDEYEENCF